MKKLGMVAIGAAAALLVPVAAASADIGSPTIAVTSTPTVEKVVWKTKSGNKIIRYLVSFKAAVTGWKMDPAAVGTGKKIDGVGHYHIYIDGKYSGASPDASGGTGRTPRLGTGVHELKLVLAYNEHTEIPATASRPFHW
jgi:hypothetical protein